MEWSTTPAQWSTPRAERSIPCKRAPALLALASLLACSTRPAASRSPDAAPPAPAPRASAQADPLAVHAREGAALYDALAEAAARYHVAAPVVSARFGPPLAREGAALREEFRRAATPDAMRVALFHFANALHNPHCAFTAPRDAAIEIDAGVGTEWVGSTPAFVVTRVGPTLAGLLRQGDSLVAVDGQSLDDDAWQTRQTRANHPLAVAGWIARYLVRRRASQSPARAGSVSHWTVAGPDGVTREVSVPWRAVPTAEERDFRVDYDAPGCADLAERAYGPYRLAARGHSLCLYTSATPPYRDYPIVRHFSFDYLEPSRAELFMHVVRADRELVAATLLAERPRGVILDLRDNRGGDNPNWFLEWYARGPYVDFGVEARLVRSLDSLDALGRAGLRDRDEDFYLAELGSAPADATFTRRRPFFCRTPACDWDNHYAPSHRVTDRPIVALVGPDTASSADTFLWHFHRNHFGPIVGERHFVAVTVKRLVLSVYMPGSDALLGSVSLALSREYDADGTEIEGAELGVDRVVTAARGGAARLDHDLVDAAIDALR